MRKRRLPRHRSRRECHPQEGMLLRSDGSRHDWLHGSWPCLTLMGAVDDATDGVPHAIFRYQEDAQGYFHLLHEILIATVYLWCCTMMVMAYFSVPKGSWSQRKNVLRGRGNRTGLAGQWSNWSLVPFDRAHPKQKEASRVLWDFLPRN